MTRRSRDQKGAGATSNLTVSLYDGDQVLVEWLVGFLGTNRSDVVRTAIRSLATSLQQIEKKGRG